MRSVAITLALWLWCSPWARAATLEEARALIAAQERTVRAGLADLDGAYGYPHAHRTLQEAFREGGGVKGHWRAWGDWLYLAYRTVRERQAALADRLREFGVRMARVATLSPAFEGYLAEAERAFGRWKRDHGRARRLLAAMVVAYTARARLLAPGSDARSAEAVGKRIEALKAELDTLFLPPLATPPPIAPPRGDEPVVRSIRFFVRLAVGGEREVARLTRGVPVKARIELDRPVQDATRTVTFRGPTGGVRLVLVARRLPGDGRVFETPEFYPKSGLSVPEGTLRARHPLDPPEDAPPAPSTGGAR